MSAGAVRAGGVFVEIGADPAKFFAALKGVNKSIASVGKSMQSAGTKMAALGAGVVGPIFASAAAFANVGSALNDMSARTGVATESLSVLQFAAEQTGTDMGGVETALKKMQKAIFAAGNGSKEAAEALAMVGLSAGDLAGLSADQQIGKIADGLMAIQDPGTRAAVAMQIFGKSGTDILPMLEGGSAGMAAFAAEAKRLGLVMDSETAAKADALGDAMDAVKSSMKMAFIQVGSAVAPILTQLAQGLAIVAANVGKFISENQAFVVSVLKGGAALFAAGTAITGVGYSLQGLSGGIGLVLKGFGLFSALASPVLLVAAGIGAAVFALYKFKDQIGAALGPVASLVQQAAGAIGEGFGPAISDGIVVLNDLATTATTTFNGVYEAIAAGDLAGAMDVLWAGLVAGWLRGTEALMSYVDPWVAAFQDVFTDIGSGIYIAWDSIYTNSKSILNTMGAYILGFFDNITNGVMNTFDTLVQNIQIAWARAQGFVTGAKDTEERIQAIKDKTALDKEKRKQDNPGIDVRTAKADQENKDAEKDRKDREQGIKDDAQATKDGRQAENQQRADARRAGVVDAETKLNDLTTAKQAEREAAKKAAEDIASTTGASAASPGEKAATAGATAAGDQSAISKAEVAGTFSSVNLGGMGFGSSLAERTAKAAEDTAKGVGQLVQQGAAGVAA
jgi:TP901 family phage tail tape measure protein